MDTVLGLRLKHFIVEMDLDLIDFLRSAYILATAAVILTASIKPLQRRFLPYGSRAEKISKQPTKNESAETKAPEGAVANFLNYVSTFQVPHSWFAHFYIVSQLSSVFWGMQILAHGQFFLFVAEHQRKVSAEYSMSLQQTFVAFMFMALQGSRRLYECMSLSKPSQSRMWFVHWALGIVFYLLMGVSVWIEGSRKLAKTKSISFKKTNRVAALLIQEFSPDELRIPKPSFKTFIAVPIFLLASGIQHDCHEYLASLPKYTLPVHPVFQSIVCPHYTCECLIYLSIAIVAAPPGQMLNKTVFAGLVFVAVNLGVTANTTRDWQVNKFGINNVGKRWKMVPFLF